jgi:hypothetical protein
MTSILPSVFGLTRAQASSKVNTSMLKKIMITTGFLILFSFVFMGFWEFFTPLSASTSTCR